MFSIKPFIFTCLASTFATMAQAQSDMPVGLWRSAPDDSGLVVHVRTRACGASLCGMVERAKDRRGYDTPSSVVGSKVMWDLKPQPDGSYAGQFREPVQGKAVPVNLKVQGNKLWLRGCDAGACRDAVWTRLR